MTFRYEIESSKAFLFDINKEEYFETNLPKLFHGDILDSSHELVSSEIRNSYLVGIFSTSQTQRFGKNKKGNIIYLVKPLNRNLPEFLVSYGGKLKGKIALRFKYSNWENKLPCGEIIEVIGNFNNDNMINILMYHHNIYPKKIKSIKDVNTNEEKLSRLVYDDNIFSIDPDDCMDIDDALSIKFVSNNTIIGVHIAQPIVWLNRENIIEKIKHQFSTLYINEERKDLWGKEITEKASLFEGEEKPAYTILFHFKDNELIKIQDYPTKIINKKKLSYDNAENYEFAKKLKEFTSKLSDINDYHDLVSYWMVKANSYIGGKLNGKVPYRVNKKSNIDINISEFPEDIGKKIIQKNIESAFYSYDENRHNTLNISNYCHFTSPIRRIMDSWIHYYLTYSLFEEMEQIDIEKINYLDKETKRFHRTIELDNLIESIFNDSITIDRRGYITDIISDNTIEVYTEDFGFLKIRIYNLKFDYLIKKVKNRSLLKLLYQDNEYDFKIGDTVDIRLDKMEAVIPKDKLKVYLVNGIDLL